MKNRPKAKRILASVVAWGFVFLSPLLYIEPSKFTFVKYEQYAVIPVLLFSLFYLNYCLLLPHYRHAHRHRFLLINIVLILFMGFVIHVWMVCKDPVARMSVYHMKSIIPSGPTEWKITLLFYIKNIMALAAASGISSAMFFSIKWTNIGKQHRMLLIQQAESELENLKTKISPHFLLNTLNNIYALTAIDIGKAQNAIMQLSKLMRYILYENQDPVVSLKSEMEFVKNYIELMKIRLAGNVEVTTEYDYPQNDTIHIAPLLEIPLIENAFKHGISPTRKSFIHIAVHADESQIEFEIKNSNYPKTDPERQGHGIGLRQVKTRLDLIYPGKYDWTTNIDNNSNIYMTKMIIYDTKLRNN